MDLKRAKDILAGLNDALAYWSTNFKKGVMDGTWECRGSHGETYLINYYDIDGTYDCTCRCFKGRKECKHGLLVTAIVRRRIAQDDNDREMRPLTLTEGHIEVLRWFIDHHITDEMNAITSRNLCTEMRNAGDVHRDQHYMARICELNKHAYIRSVEGYEGERLPPDSHYYLTMKGRKAMGERTCQGTMGRTSISN